MMWNLKVAEIMVAAARRLERLSAATDSMALDIRRNSGTLRSIVTEAEHTDAELAHLIGGIPADARFGGSRTLLDRLEHDPPGAEGLFYDDLRDYVRRHEMPPEMREKSPDNDGWEWAETGTRDATGQEPSESAQWLANRTWGRAIQIKQDHLRSQGVAGRAYAQAMWDWKDKLERIARDHGDPLPFSPEIAGKEPYMREVYRGDGQSREEIFEHGFRPWRDNLNPDHTLMDPRPGYDSRIYTSKNPDVAAGYPLEDPGRHVYVIEDTRNYTDIEDARKNTDINDPNGPRYAAGEEGEVVFPIVPADKVKGELIDSLDPSAGLIPNPNFTPHEPDPIRPPREDGD